MTRQYYLRFRAIALTLRGIAFLLTTMLLGSFPLAAQQAKASVPAKTPVKTWTPPKTPWGEPDLQGQWPAVANIPMQRPASFGTRAVLTDEELQQRELQADRPR